MTATPESSSKQSTTTVAVSTSTTSYLSSIFYLPFYMIGSFRSWIYDTFILKMTTKWYHTVLMKIPENSIILDVGIGTAGALLNCSHILKERQIKVVGLDYDEDYIHQAKAAISKANLEDHVRVICMSVYDVYEEQDQLWDIVPSTWFSTTATAGNHKKESTQKYFDAIYFSGSFSLLPDMSGALNVVQQLLQKGKIYITQTYQRKTPPLLPWIKPLLRYMITIDFGQLITESKAYKLFHEEFVTQCNVTVQDHSVIPGSIDTVLQAAYLTILVPNNQE